MRTIILQAHGSRSRMHMLSLDSLAESEQEICMSQRGIRVMWGSDVTRRISEKGVHHGKQPGVADQ